MLSIDGHAMWKSIELPIDVTASVPLPGPLEIAASVFLPDPGKLTIPPIVIFALPGGGYTDAAISISKPLATRDTARPSIIPGAVLSS